MYTERKKKKEEHCECANFFLIKRQKKVIYKTFLFFFNINKIAIPPETCFTTNESLNFTGIVTAY